MDQALKRISHFWYLIGVQVLSGLAWGGFNLGCGNLLFDYVPAAQRVSYVAVHNVLVAAGVFLGGLIGIGLINFLPERATWLGNQSVLTPLLNVFLVSFLLRLLISSLFLKRIRERRGHYRPRLRREYIFRMTRFSAFMGLMYDFVTESRTDKDKKENAGL